MGPEVAKGMQPKGEAKTDVQRKKHEDQILDQAAQIKGDYRRFAEALIHAAPEPPRNLCLRDYMLQEMHWVAQDMMQERVWKRAVAKHVAETIVSTDARAHLKPVAGDSGMRPAASADEGKPAAGTSKPSVSKPNGSVNTPDPPSEADGDHGCLRPAQDAAFTYVCSSDVRKLLHKQLGQVEEARLLTHAHAVREYREAYKQVCSAAVEAALKAQVTSNKEKARDLAQALTALDDDGKKPRSKKARPSLLEVDNASLDPSPSGTPHGSLQALHKKGRHHQGLPPTASTPLGSLRSIPELDIPDERSRRSKRKVSHIETREFDDEDYLPAPKLGRGSLKLPRTPSGMPDLAMQASLPASKKPKPGVPQASKPLQRADSLVNRMPSMQARTFPTDAARRPAAGGAAWSAADDQLLCAIITEFSTSQMHRDPAQQINWLLVSDVFTSTTSMQGVCRRPDICKMRYNQLLKPSENPEPGSNATPSPDGQGESALTQMSKQQAKEVLSAAMPVPELVLKRHSEVVAALHARIQTKRVQEKQQIKENHKHRAEPHASHVKLVQQAIAASGGRVLNPLELAPIEVPQAQLQMQHSGFAGAVVEPIAAAAAPAAQPAPRLQALPPGPAVPPGTGVAVAAQQQAQQMGAAPAAGMGPQRGPMVPGQVGAVTAMAPAAMGMGQQGLRTQPPQVQGVMDQRMMGAPQVQAGAMGLPGPAPTAVGQQAVSQAAANAMQAPQQLAQARPPLQPGTTIGQHLNTALQGQNLTPAQRQQLLLQLANRRGQVPPGAAGQAPGAMPQAGMQQAQQQQGPVQPMRSQPTQQQQQQAVAAAQQQQSQAQQQQAQQQAQQQQAQSQQQVTQQHQQQAVAMAAVAAAQRASGYQQVPAAPSPTLQALPPGGMGPGMAQMHKPGTMQPGMAQQTGAAQPAPQAASPAAYNMQAHAAMRPGQPMAGVPATGMALQGGPGTGSGAQQVPQAAAVLAAQQQPGIPHAMVAAAPGGPAGQAAAQPAGPQAQAMQNAALQASSSSMGMPQATVQHGAVGGSSGMPGSMPPAMWPVAAQNMQQAQAAGQVQQHMVQPIAAGQQSSAAAPSPGQQQPQAASVAAVAQAHQAHLQAQMQQMQQQQMAQAAQAHAQALQHQQQQAQLQVAAQQMQQQHQAGHPLPQQQQQQQGLQGQQAGHVTSTQQQQQQLQGQQNGQVAAQAAQQQQQQQQHLHAPQQQLPQAILQQQQLQQSGQQQQQPQSIQQQAMQHQQHQAVALAMQQLQQQQVAAAAAAAAQQQQSQAAQQAVTAAGTGAVPQHPGSPALHMQQQVAQLAQAAAMVQMHPKPVTQQQQS